MSARPWSPCESDRPLMAFKDFLVTVRNDHLRQLRCEKTLQSSDPSQFLDLLGDARLKPTVQPCHLFRALPKLAQKPGVLHCDHRLRREVLCQCDFFV